MSDVVRRYRALVGESGASFDHFSYGPSGVGLVSEADHRFADGDFMAVDFGCTFQRFFADTGTTLVLRSLPKALLAKHVALHECVEAGAELARPGVRASVVQAAMHDALAEHDIIATFPHGHGLGLEVRDFPILVPDSGLSIGDDCINVSADLPLEANMVINLEVTLYLFGSGSLEVERTLLVTPNGSEPLIEQDRSLPYQVYA